MSDVDKAAKTILVAISERIQAETEKAMADALSYGAGFLRFGNGTIRHVPYDEVIYKGQVDE